MTRLHRKRALLLVAVAAATLALSGDTTSYADAVTSFTPGPAGELSGVDALGPPTGGGDYQGSDQVATLGEGGELVLHLSIPALDGPGTDLIVFENPFRVLSAPATTFSEVVTVEVSSDGANWARFPNAYLGPPSQVGPFQGVRPEWYLGFAGALPVHAHPALGVSSLDPVEAGGDAFDLADLADDPAVTAGLVDLNDVRHVRLVDVVSGSDTDDQGMVVYDAGLGSGASADIDAVSAVNNIYNQTADRPAVELTLDGAGFLTMVLSDPKGLDHIVPRLQASINGQVVDFYTQVLPFFLIIQLDAQQATLITGPIPPGLLNVVFKVSGEDWGGLVSGDAVHIH